MRKRKKLLQSLLFVLACGVLFTTGCTKETEKKQKQNQEETAKAAYYISYENNRIYILDDIVSVIKVLGDDYDYFEAASCAFSGMDRFYYYKNLTIMTNEIQGKEVVTDMYFTNDVLATPEGIRIGSEYAKVIDAYGSDYEINGTAMEYSDGNTILKIDMGEEKVSAIEYEYK